MVPTLLQIIQQASAGVQAGRSSPGLATAPVAGPNTPVPPKRMEWEQEASKLDEQIAKKQAEREKLARAIGSFDPPKVNPSPIRPGAGALVTLISALTKQPGLLQGFMSGAQNREGIRVQNETSVANQRLKGMGIEQDILGDQIQDLGRRRGDALTEGRYQQTRKDQERNHLDDLAKEADRNAQGNRQGFSVANTPAEARYFARLTQGSKYAVSPEELRSQVQFIGNPRVKEFGARVTQIKDKFDLSEEDLKGLREERAQIIKDYELPEGAIPPVLTSVAYRKQAMDARKVQVDNAHKLAREKFTADQTQKKWVREIKFPKDLAVKWAMVDVARQAAVTAGMNNQLGALRFEQSILDSASVGLVGDFDKEIRNLELKEISLRRQFESPTGKNDKEKALNGAKANQEWHVVQKQMEYLKELRAQQNQARIDAGMPEIKVPERGVTGEIMFPRTPPTFGQGGTPGRPEPSGLQGKIGRGPKPKTTTGGNQILGSKPVK